MLSENDADKEENGRDVSVDPQQPWCGATGGSLLNTFMTSDRIAKCPIWCVLEGSGEEET